MTSAGSVSQSKSRAAERAGCCQLEVQMMHRSPAAACFCITGAQPGRMRCASSLWKKRSTSCCSSSSAVPAYSSAASAPARSAPAPNPAAYRANQYSAVKKKPAPTRPLCISCCIQCQLLLVSIIVWSKSKNATPFFCPSPTPPLSLDVAGAAVTAAVASAALCGSGFGVSTTASMFTTMVGATPASPFSPMPADYPRPRRRLSAPSKPSEAKRQAGKGVL
mmetsp:Transcript_28209/g.70806  ORF Transcript_28209/g.70806 Transcript_28209/m.70806 type:complete len:221 (-) Transcript_28209:161-823(-)